MLLGFSLALKTPYPFVHDDKESCCKCMGNGDAVVESLKLNAHFLPSNFLVITHFCWQLEHSTTKMLLSAV